MYWLNWSFNFHIRLKTISHLVPTHITHVYVQWMFYSFVWLYLINCVVHTQSYVDQTQKYFWVFLVAFGKCFVLKIFRKTKFFCTLFLQLTLVGQANRKTPIVSLLRSSRDSLASQSPSRKKYLEISGFLDFSRLNLVTYSWVETLVASLHKLICDSHRDLLMSGLSRREKHLDKFFKKFCQGILATHVGNLLATNSSHKNHVFCTNRVKSNIVFKNFFIFPRIMCTHFVLSSSPFPSPKTSIFFINLQEKV